MTLTGGPSPIRVYVWNALEIVRDPYSGAGAGKVTLTATALVSVRSIFRMGLRR